jgi:hypothetical protein
MNVKIGCAVCRIVEGSVACNGERTMVELARGGYLIKRRGIEKEYEASQNMSQMLFERIIPIISNQGGRLCASEPTSRLVQIAKRNLKSQ